MKRRYIQSTPTHFVLLGLLLYIPFFLLLAHVYFEQWVWSFYRWIHDYHGAWWSLTVSIETSVLLVAFLLLVGFLLPVAAHSVLKSKQPIVSSIIMIVSLYIILVIVYTLSRVFVAGREPMMQIIRDVAGSQISFIISVFLLILLPFMLFVTFLRWWQHRRPAQRDIEGLH